MRIECDRCGKVRMVNEAYTRQRDMRIRDILARMRHEDCGGRAGKVELITGIGGRQQPSGAEDRAARVRQALQAPEHGQHAKPMVG
jgi:hypothetical protein